MGPEQFLGALGQQADAHAGLELLPDLREPDKPAPATARWIASAMGSRS
jgi:hypothetical protein